MMWHVIDYIWHITCEIWYMVHGMIIICSIIYQNLGWGQAKFLAPFERNSWRSSARSSPPSVFEFCPNSACSRRELRHLPANPTKTKPLPQKSFCDSTASRLIFYNTERKREKERWREILSALLAETQQSPQETNSLCKLQMLKFGFGKEEFAEMHNLNASNYFRMVAVKRLQSRTVNFQTWL